MTKPRTRIGLIHATMNSVQPILKAFQQHAPEVAVLNFMDEGLIDELNRTGVVTEDMVGQLTSLMKRAEQSGVDGLLLTCSSFSPYVAQVRPQFTVPVLAADIAMLEHAVQQAGRIGVIATVGAAGPTTTKLLYEIAAERSKTIQVETKVLTEAFAALQQGNAEEHNTLIRRQIERFAEDCDCIVLAQMSMCRALEGWNAPAEKPVLTSPEISLRAILAKVSERENVK